MKQLTDEEKEAESDKARKVYSEEFLKAAHRVTSEPRNGQRSEHFIRWAIAFTRKDRSLLSHGQLRDLEYEITFFVRDISRPVTGGTKTPVFDPAELWAESALNDEESYSYRDEIILQRLPSRGTVFELQRLTIKHLEELLKSGRTEMALPPNTKIWLFITKWQGVTSADLSLSSSPETIYEQRLLADLSHHPDYLRRCPGCEQLFFADRKNQDFHTTACRSRHYMRLRRDIPPERFGILGRRKSVSKEVGPPNIPQSVKNTKQPRISSSKKTGKTIKSPRRKESGHGKKRR